MLRFYRPNIEPFFEFVSQSSSFRVAVSARRRKDVSPCAQRKSNVIKKVSSVRTSMGSAKSGAVLVAYYTNSPKCEATKRVSRSFFSSAAAWFVPFLNHLFFKPIRYVHVSLLRVAGAKLQWKFVISGAARSAAIRTVVYTTQNVVFCC